MALNVNCSELEKPSTNQIHLSAYRMFLLLCFSQHDNTLVSYCPLGIDRSTLADNSDDDGGGGGSGSGS